MPEPVYYDVYVRRVTSYHGVIRLPVPPDRVNATYEEGYARGHIQALIDADALDGDMVRWDSQVEQHIEVSDVQAVGEKPLSGNG